MSFARLLLPLLLLAACGGPPDGPLTRIAVPPSYSTYLPSLASKPYSRIVATALQAQKLPAVADYAAWEDWRIDLRIKRDHGMATPSFTLVDAAGEDQGVFLARPVPFDVWKRARTDILTQAANEVAPRIATLVAQLQADRRRTAVTRAARQADAETARAAAARQQAERARQAAEREYRTDPNSLFNRQVRVVLTGITGAPGDGNRALAWLVIERLGRTGHVVQDNSSGADFTIKAKVDEVPEDATTRRIEVVWLIHNSRQDEVGEIVQLKEVPAGSLDRQWGNFAIEVADEAAGAIRDVILTQTGRR